MSQLYFLETEFIATSAGVADAGKPAKTNVSGLIDSTMLTGVLQSTVVTLTAAQIKLLYSTPISLVPTPGSGKFISVVSITATNTYATAAFTGGNNLEFRFTNGSGTKVTADMASSFINIASGTQTDNVLGVEADTQMTLNAAVVVCVPTADPGGATAAGTIKVTTYYRTITA
jgi:hypothetical protein